MPFQTYRSLRSAGAAGAYFRRSVLERLAALLAITLPLVGLFVAHERAQLDTIARDESNRNVQNLAHAFAEETRSSMVTIDLSLSQLRLSWLRNPEQFGAIVAELNTHLHGKLQMNVAVTDARGRLVFSSIPNVPTQLNLADRDHVSVHLQGPPADRLFIGQPLKGRLSGRWTVQFSRPILDAAGKLSGVIVAGVEPAYFSRFYIVASTSARTPRSPWCARAASRVAWSLPAPPSTSRYATAASSWAAFHMRRIAAPMAPSAA